MEKIFEDFDINSFKTAVINAICENSEIVYILDKEYIDSGGGLLWNKLFPYPRIPNTKEETTPYICFKVDHIKNKNAFIETIDVVIYVVCHQKEMNKKDFELVKERVIDQLKTSLSPELLNRIDHKVVFKPLSKDDLKAIFNMQLATFLEAWK